MAELTKEWLQNMITGIESVIDDKSFVCDEIGFKIGEVKNILTAFKVALASLEAEPIAWECGENIILFNPDTVEAYAKRAEISPKPLYAAPPVSVTPDAWISCSERMPERNQNVLISVNFDSSLVEPLICSARYTGSTFRRGDATIKPGNGIEQATHWMPLPEPPQEEKSGNADCTDTSGKTDNPQASGKQVNELTMLVKQLVSQLRKAKPDCKLPDKAMSYLERNGLISVEDILR